MKLYTNQSIKTVFIWAIQATLKLHGDVVLFKLAVFKHELRKHILSYKYSTALAWNDYEMKIIYLMYDLKHNLSENCLKYLFSAVNGNKSHSQSGFAGLGIITVFCIANSIRYFGSVIWNSLSNDLRNICDFDLFKTTIRRYNPVEFPCRLCKHYLDGLVFITVSN